MENIKEHVLINPYNLLGVNINSKMEELKVNYRELAMICHPDKGGSANDMCILHNAYIYVKKQLENRNDTVSYDDLEDDFNLFCENQKNIPPPFKEICKEFNDKFNKEFVKMMEKRDNDLENIFPLNNTNPYTRGYGGMMDSSNYNIDEIQTGYQVENSISIKSKKIFPKKDIIIYKEPLPLTDAYTDNFYDLEKKPIEDFSFKNGKILGNDYINAFALPNPEIKNEKIIESKCNINDFNLEYLPYYDYKTCKFKKDMDNSLLPNEECINENNQKKIEDVGIMYLTPLNKINIEERNECIHSIREIWVPDINNPIIAPYIPMQLYKTHNDDQISKNEIIFKPSNHYQTNILDKSCKKINIKKKGNQKVLNKYEKNLLRKNGKESLTNKCKMFTNGLTDIKIQYLFLKIHKNKEGIDLNRIIINFAKEYKNSKLPKSYIGYLYNAAKYYIGKLI